MANKYVDWVKKQYEEYKQNKKEKDKETEEELTQSWKFEDDNARMNASDSVEFGYGYKYGTSFHKNIIDRLKTYKDVSSPGATNKRADAMIWLSFVGKLLSIYMSYVSILYLYSHGLKTQLNVNPMIEVVFIFSLAIVWEWLSGAELKSIFNATENKTTRFTGLAVGLTLTVAGLYLHIYYQDLQSKVNHSENSSKVLKVDTPATLAVKSKIENVDTLIKIEKDKLKSENSSLEEQKADYNKQIKELEEKRDYYKNILKEIEAHKRKTWKRKGVVYTKLNGKATRVSSIPGYIRYRDKKIAEIAEKKANLAVPQSARLTELTEQKTALTVELEKAYNASKAQMDKVSDSSGHAGLLFQLFITFLAKIDFYGYFLLRANIKNSVLEKMHDIIDEFNAVNEMAGIFGQFSRMNTQTLRAIGHSSLGVNNEIAAVNRSIVANGNRFLKSNKKLLMAIERQVDKGVIEANYQPIGDSRVDREADNPEVVLTEWLRRMGYTQDIVFAEDVETSRLVGNVIYVNPNHSEDDIINLIRHELSHVEAETSEHDEAFKDGIDKVSEKETKVSKPIFNMKRKTYRFSIDRALKILTDYGFGKEINLSQSEIQYFKDMGVWNGKLNVSDYSTLMELLNV